MSVRCHEFSVASACALDQLIVAVRVVDVGGDAGRPELRPHGVGGWLGVIENISGRLLAAEKTAENVSIPPYLSIGPT